MKFLFPYMARWHSANWSRYHQLLSALCRRGHEAFVLQPPPLDLAETNYADVEGAEQEGLHLYQVEVFPPLWRRRFPQEKLVKKGLYSLVCARRVRDMVLQERIDVLLIYNLPQHILVGNLPCLKVFDIADDLPAMLEQEVGRPLGGLLRRMGQAWQRRLALSCDLALVASQTLQERLPFPTALVPNGVYLDEVAAAEGTMLRRQFRGPVVGYLGAFEYFVDMHLVIDVAKRLDGVTFVLVGGGRAWKEICRRVEVEGLSNVVLPGPVSHPQGLNYVAAMDVCLIPFRRGLVADGACPLKLFEYAALRKPIVSTSTTEVVRIARDYVSFADTADQMCRAIQDALAATASQRERQEIGYAQACETYSWDKIVGQFLAAIEKLNPAGRASQASI